ncbi:hypothetical protein RRG08_028382 [Elysia crispata]|uniref:Uncharacterized protein n=1 Tax=Elysia crispata TaxID=231223 RepID=A0AAE1EBW1_9GAST|nr:hypothetical protein RRG08_028382 [Elysia crispata]
MRLSQISTTIWILRRNDQTQDLDLGSGENQEPPSTTSKLAPDEDLYLNLDLDIGPNQVSASSELNTLQTVGTVYDIGPSVNKVYTVQDNEPISASSELTTLQTVSSETMPSTVGDIGPSDEKVCTAQDASNCDAESILSITGASDLSLDISHVSTVDFDNENISPVPQRCNRRPHRETWKRNVLKAARLEG